MLMTRTGAFPVGFRRGGGDWQADLDALLRWALANELSVIDLGADADTAGRQVKAAGLRIGSADLREVRALLSPDPAKRRDAVAHNAGYVAAAAAAGARNFFACMLPEKPDLPRRDNFGFMVESLSALAPALERAGAHIVIEGWPGPGALCCTPETLRATFKEVPSDAIGINYDPSHLIRMSIDPIRFLEEFGQRVYHVHGKDTEILTENLYTYGTEQQATFCESYGFGAWSWRYTIPGHGQMRWTKAFQVLQSLGYRGAVCVELEDANFNGTTPGEQQGILAGAQFLAGC